LETDLYVKYSFLTFSRTALKYENYYTEKCHGYISLIYFTKWLARTQGRYPKVP